LLVFQSRTDIALAVQNANYGDAIGSDQIIDAEFVEAVDF
jgi:hypothetical protein